VVFDNDGTSLSILNQDYDIKPFLGDVRTVSDLEEVIDKYDFDGVFHGAALKQVPLCEEYPSKAFNVNVGGTKNVLKVADCPVVNVSTDKAVNPVNVMGLTKYIAEKEVEKSVESVNVRFGNVLRSAGSVIPLFEKQVERGDKLTVTDPEMTRFFMSKEEAAELLVYAFNHRDEAELFIPEMESFNLGDLADRIGGDYEETGVREGEKTHEELVTEGELSRARFKDGFLHVGSFEGVEKFSRVSKNAIVNKDWYIGI